MDNQNVMNMTDNIPDDKFRVIGFEEDAEIPTRPRIGYWADAWRRFRHNKIALLALVNLQVHVFFINIGPKITG